MFWNSLYIAFFLLPIDINYPTPFFILAIVFGSLNALKGDKKYIWENKVLLVFPLYYLILVLSLLSTARISEGFDLVIRSLSLFLFPILFLFVKEDASSVRKLFDFLLYGLVLSFCMNLFAVVYDVVLMIQVMELTFWDRITNFWLLFMNEQFSALINPSYVSLYILLVLSYYLKKELNTIWRLLTDLILFLYLFLLANEDAYFTVFIMAVLFV